MYVERDKTNTHINLLGRVIAKVLFYDTGSKIYTLDCDTGPQRGMAKKYIVSIVARSTIASSLPLDVYTLYSEKQRKFARSDRVLLYQYMYIEYDISVL